MKKMIFSPRLDHHPFQSQSEIICPRGPMEFPRGFIVPGGVDRKDVVLKLHHNLYGQKQAGRVWYEYLCKQLVTKAGFIQSKNDEYLFYRGKVMYALYIDDSILGAPTQKELEAALKQSKTQNYKSHSKVISLITWE